MIEKLLKHLTNAPVAVALAFLLVGAPAAPVAKMLPSSGDAVAEPEVCYATYLFPPGGLAPYVSPMNSFRGVDSDCDGVPDEVDICPGDYFNQCQARCTRADRIVDYSSLLAGGGGVLALLRAVTGVGTIALLVGVGGMVYGQMEREFAGCY